MARNSHLFDILREKALDGVLKKYVNLDDDGEVDRFLKSLLLVNLDNVNLLRYLMKLDTEQINFNEISPVSFSQIDDYEGQISYKRLGVDMIRGGRVAFLIFSGGAATRLKEQYPELRGLYLNTFGIDIGHDPNLPKGLIPITPAGYFTFIHLFAEQLLRLQYEYRTIINLIVMVSGLTESYIRDYFESNNYFGLMRRAVFFLRQRENPRLDEEGDMIFDGEKIITTGDGHGGVFRALIESHLRDELIIRGVDAVVMFNVDNPLARFFDPIRIGYHFARNSEFTISAVKKTEPSEKIGVVALDGKLDRYRVVEYNLLRDEQKNLRDGNNDLLYSCGHINVNIAGLSIVDKKFSPIIYRNKKIIVRNRQILTNSLEWLNQDIVTVLPKSVVNILGLKREDFFLPTKNVKGVDSIGTTIEGLNRYYKSLLDNSCKFHKSSVIDLSPSFILDERDNHRLRNLTMEENTLFFVRGCLDANEEYLLLNKGITIERGGVLKIICKNPFGDFDYDYVSNSATPNKRLASKIQINKPIRIKAGSKILFEIEEGGMLIVNSEEFMGEIGLRVERNQKVEI
ncbi:MAG: UTP--glucose-1-phosphate uridylyltransferase [Myxococcota bacterium]